NSTCRLFDADLLVGSAAHYFLLELSAVDAGFRSYFVALLFSVCHRIYADRQFIIRPKGRVFIGRVPFDFANHCACNYPACGDCTADALGYVRSSWRRLCPHGESERFTDAARGWTACTA